jgi:hypothetical protein
VHKFYLWVHDKYLIFFEKTNLDLKKFRKYFETRVFEGINSLQPITIHNFENTQSLYFDKFFEKVYRLVIFTRDSNNAFLRIEKACA